VGRKIPTLKGLPCRRERRVSDRMPNSQSRNPPSFPLSWTALDSAAMPISCQLMSISCHLDLLLST